MEVFLTIFELTFSILLFEEASAGLSAHHGADVRFEVSLIDLSLLFTCYSKMKFQQTSGSVLNQKYNACLEKQQQKNVEFYCVSYCCRTFYIFK